MSRALRLRQIQALSHLVDSLSERLTSKPQLREAEKIKLKLERLATQTRKSKPRRRPKPVGEKY